MVNVEEWSREFDILFDNITSAQAPGLTEYEKSVFLTRAEEVVLVMLYNGTLRNSFEETEEVTAYLNTLVSQASCKVTDKTVPHIIPSSVVYEMPSDLLFRTLEMCRVSVSGCGEQDAIVVPVTQDEFWRTYRNPFKKQNARRVLRLSYTDYAELVSDTDIVEYAVRYIRKPKPIILTDLTEDGFSINGETGVRTCELPEILHQTILMEAVKAAKAVWAS